MTASPITKGMRSLFSHRHRGASHVRRHLGPPHIGGGPTVGYGSPNDGQDYVDRSQIDFDPVEGLYTGTAVTTQHAHTALSDRRSLGHLSVAQRAAEHETEVEKIGHDPLAVQRHPSPEAADIAAAQEIGHNVM